MPELVNSRVGSLPGTSDAEGTTVWPRLLKNSRKSRRMSAVVGHAGACVEAGMWGVRKGGGRRGPGARAGLGLRGCRALALGSTLGYQDAAGIRSAGPCPSGLVVEVERGGRPHDVAAKTPPEQEIRGLAPQGRVVRHPGAVAPA